MKLIYYFDGSIPPDKTPASSEFPSEGCTITSRPSPCNFIPMENCKMTPVLTPKSFDTALKIFAI